MTCCKCWSFLLYFYRHFIKLLIKDTTFVHRSVKLLSNLRIPVYLGWFCSFLYCTGFIIIRLHGTYPKEKRGECATRWSIMSQRWFLSVYSHETELRDPKWIGIRRSEAALSIFLQRHLITGAQSRSSGLHRMCIICLLLPSHISFPSSLPPSLILPPLSFFFSFPTLAFLASNCRFFLVFATELASSTLELSN